ncbi:hypothetical protein J5J10_11610 [Ciceribacter sp. L1K23]|uniref:hypothetical protein n=1 Tax=Ciceribacter sp. L1K23 TaxID=2820276 RepID=UPI001B8191BF|nr:hypothetical protein [Ciceribacter sp. L1K23]MBR0556324.1 hypothetical protein [Ciceribacter sp. L1K23]
MALTATELQSSPRFVTALKGLATQLQGQFDGNPKLSRFMASHQRWLLSQAAFALQLEYDPAVGGSGLTTGRLKEMILTVKAASRNTVLNFLDQLMAYRYMRRADDGGRRPRRFEATDISTQAMYNWFLANLAALDSVDDGNRVAEAVAEPRIFRLAQPRIARHCIADDRWREPPPRVALFLWTESGGLVMDEIVSRIEVGVDEDRFDLGRIDARAMAGRFLMSRTHLQRLLRKGVELGCLAWHDEAKKTHMWMTRDYLDEYCGWQAVKFSIVDEAFDWARAELKSRAEPQPAE